MWVLTAIAAFCLGASLVAGLVFGDSTAAIAFGVSGCSCAALALLVSLVV